MVTSEQIQRLREETGSGVMECKRALQDANGDVTAAKKLLMERGAAKAEKKADRKTGAGFLESYIHGGRVGVLLELRCETDFVTRSEPFKALAHELVLQVAAMNPENVEELYKAPYIRDAAVMVESLVKQTIAKVGENIRVERFCRYEL